MMAILREFETCLVRNPQWRLDALESVQRPSVGREGLRVEAEQGACAYCDGSVCE